MVSLGGKNFIGITKAGHPHLTMGGYVKSIALPQLYQGSHNALAVIKKPTALVFWGKDLNKSCRMNVLLSSSKR